MKCQAKNKICTNRAELLLRSTCSAQNQAWACKKCYERVKDWGMFEILEEVKEKV